MIIKVVKNKSLKWWIGIISCFLLFSAIGVFAYMKMQFLMTGVKIMATINHDDNSSIIKVEGNAKNAVYISLNGREIFIDKDGTFSEAVALAPGLSVITLDAQDRFGKSAEKKFEVMYKENPGLVAFNEE